MEQARGRLAPWRVAIIFAVALAAYTAFTVTPAVAAANEQSTSVCESTVFDGLNSQDKVASAAPGLVAREPAVTQVLKEMPASATAQAAGNFEANVPVYFHVVHADGVGNISNAVINEQMRVLNAAYAGFYGGPATGFSFQLAGVTRTNNAEWHFAGIGSPAERDMKQALHQGGWNALNLYAVSADVYLGWAYFPGLSQSRQYLDGVIVNWESMPGASERFAGRYDLGHTATHEVGHWINLHHVFNGGCNENGDYVDDTPPQRVATNGCPVGQDSCTEPGLDSIHNYMDYSYDACYNQFTPGQVQRMQDAWLFYRA